MLIVGLLLILPFRGYAGERGTLLVVERPDQFVIYNKYQQRLTSSEYRILPATVVALVLRENDKLSDGLTLCVPVEIEGSAFYILRENDGAFGRRGSGGSIAMFRDALLLGDTVSLERGKALRFRAMGSNREAMLPPGSLAVRLFAAGGRTFVRVLPGERRAGWLQLSGFSSSSGWRIVRDPPTVRLSGEAIAGRLAPVVADANRVLREIFAHLAPGAEVRQPVPSFNVRMAPGEVICCIQPEVLAASYAGSLRAFVPECERVLRGTGLRPVLSGGSIVVSLR